MKLFKKICLILMLMFFALSVLILLSYFLMYKTVDMVYLGSAKGIWDSNFYPDSDKCMENDFLYYNMGYAVLGDETVTRCCMSDFDFQFKKRAGKIYVYSYGCPLIKLEYNRGKFSEEGICYNKAVFAKDKFQDGIYYFYEADDVPIGNCVGNWELDPVILEEEEMDDIMLELGIAVIIFILMSCLNMDIPVHRFAFFYAYNLYTEIIFHSLNFQRILQKELRNAEEKNCHHPSWTMQRSTMQSCWRIFLYAG